MPDSHTTTPIGPPTTWEPLQHNTANQTTGGIWRVTAPGGTAILKHLTPGTDTQDHWAASDDPRHWNYWKREYLAYTTGTAAAYGHHTSITAPALLETTERADGTVELWIEAVDGLHGRDWTTPAFAAFAHDLGRAQAHHTSTPDQPWHSRRWLRQYAGRAEYTHIPWHHPVAAEHWPTRLREDLRMIWEHRRDLFDLAETLPQTLCHLDVWPMNLVLADTGPVLLDWAFTGRGAIGEDIANLIADTFLDGLRPVTDLPETEQALTDAYINGLAEAGHPTDHTRKAIATTGAAKYAWLAPMMLTRLDAGQDVGSASYDAETDHRAILYRRRPIFEMIATWARTALDT
ncbi:phosphotransferase family protein [Glycomyces salinus]|uniref:phosphotransferase family protein n=1 Tax=Glycomyces salinus TaxID=980294 RepID=UPI001E46016D|nr:aminoglycoside phosphotransferase family protein [Glycomyces salinus]